MSATFAVHYVKWLLTAIRLPSCRCPAKEAASLATPSMRQPSPVNTITTDQRQNGG